MKTLSWLGRVSLVPAVGVGLLVWWVTAVLTRNGYDLSTWAVLLLFGGLALSRAAPRLALYDADRRVVGREGSVVLLEGGLDEIQRLPGCGAGARAFKVVDWF